MALYITQDCINCDVCEPVCPNSAIRAGRDIFVIDPELCTECVGHFNEPQCRSICPVDCIPADPQRIETRTQLMERFQRLHPSATACAAGSTIGEC